jgi:type II secretion system protein I
VNARGFTLLEVLVALAILGIAVVASIQGFAQSLRLLKVSGDHQEAMLLADQKIRDVTTPNDGRDEGTDARFQWTRTITRVQVPELVADGRPARWGVFEIDVRVRWDERREVHLASLRTVALDATGQPTQPPLAGTPAPAGTSPPRGTPPPFGTPPPATTLPSPRSPSR